MHILVLESYDSGSHKQFLDGLIGHSGNRFIRKGLPGRKWKWRMRGSGIYFAQQLQTLTPAQTDAIDLIFTSDMTPVADLKSLLPDSLRQKPIVCYFHENQLTYPLPDESQRDYQYGFTNITSALAADQVWFNSSYHREIFLAAVAKLLKKMPDYVPDGIAEQIRSKSEVMPLALPDDCFGLRAKSRQDNQPIVILWNHRWEYDKNPDEFFEVMFDLQRAGVNFKLIVAGETFRDSPPIFQAARSILAEEIIHFGYARDRQQYLQLLAQADIVVSTAIHEFFGLAVLEAMAAGCYPLLPQRLSYPELLPHSTHGQYLYPDRGDLLKRLIHLNNNPETLCRSTVITRTQIDNYRWGNTIARYDKGFEKIITQQPEAKYAQHD